MPLTGCRIFDGIDDHAETTAFVDLSATDIVTFLARVWWDEWLFSNLVEFSYALSAYAGSFGIKSSYYDAPGTWSILMSTAGTPVVVHQRFLTTPPSIETWHALAVVLDRTKAGAQEIAVYVDGILMASTWVSTSIGGGYPTTEDCSGKFMNMPLFLMSNQGVQSFGKGRLCDVALYTTALTPGEIAAYASGVTGDQFGAPKCYWPLNGLENPEPDLSGHDYHLTVSGTTRGLPPPTIPILEVAAGHVTIGGNGSLFVGEDKVLALSAPAGADGTPDSLRGQSIVFELRKTDTSETAILSKAATVVGTYSTTRASNTERARAPLTDTETATLEGGAIYRHSWKRLDAGAERVLAYGWFYPERATQL